MRFLFSALLALTAAAFASAGKVAYQFSGSEYVCDIRNCTATANDPAYSFGGNWLIDPVYTGFVRLINGVYPAPAIIATEDDIIQVTYTNRFMAEATTLHWHGMFQIGTDFMDGVSMVSQCPIERDETYVYNFRAFPAGSHWYHSHQSIEAIEGIAGALIVSRQYEPLASLYQEELIFAFTQLWTSTKITETITDGISVALVNGLFTDNTAKWPEQTFQVQSGKCYRLRLMYLDANDNHQSLLKVHIAGHNQKIVQVDGIDTDHQDFGAITMVFAQRTDTIFCPKAGKFNYKMWFTPKYANNPRGDVGINPAFYHIFAVDGASPSDAWGADTGRLTTDHDMTYSDLSQTTTTPANLPTGLNPKLYKHIGFEDGFVVPNATHSLTFHIGVYVSGEMYSPNKAYMYMYKETPWKFPETPSVFSEECYDDATFQTTLPYDAVIDIVFNNGFPAVHPLHLHGGVFFVLGNSFAAYNIGYYDTVDLAPCPAPELFLPEKAFLPVAWGCQYVASKHQALLNTKNPVIRDTAGVPAHGWVVLRWRANNPGYWFFHCHTEGHMNAGMLHLFNVAPELRPETPSNLKQCGWCRTDIPPPKGNTELNINNAPAVSVVVPSTDNTTPTQNIVVQCQSSSPVNNAPASTVNVNFNDMFNGFSPQ